MNIFDLLIVQPIFNLLVLIYALLPGSNFGVALIIFTIFVRLAMWPLIKKQLHQTKVQRAIQPELKKIKAKAKGNKQLEGQLMLELYREKGINPMSSIGTLFLQLPIFIALFSVINIITKHPEQITKFTYDVLEKLGPVQGVINTTTHNFDATLLGVVNLSNTALGAGAVYWPLLVLALISAGLQYIQTKQISPAPAENKRLRDLFSESAEGKEVDQSEVSAIMTQRMTMFFPILTFVAMIYLPGAIVLYTVVSSIVAIIQQKVILGKDVDEMEQLARINSGSVAKQRADSAVEAEVVSVVAPKARGKKRSKRR